MYKFRKVTSKVCVALLATMCINGYFISDVLAESGQNLLSNGDFENTSDNSWKTSNDSGKANITLDNNVFHGNSGHAEKIQGNSVSAAVAKKISITPGKEYFLSTWMKGQNVTKSDQSYGEAIAVQQVDKSGNLITATTGYSAKTGTFDWKQTGVSFVADKNADSVVVILQLSGSGTAWFDDVSLVQSSSNSGLFPNGGFENTLDESLISVQQKGTATIATDDKIFHGSSGHSKKVTGNNAQAFLCREIPVDASKQYSFSVWGKGQNITSDNNNPGEIISIVQRDKDGKVIDNTEKDFAKSGTFDWIQVPINFTADSKATSVIVYLGLSGSGTAWFDDVALTESNGSQLNSNIKRLAGSNRIETSLEIAKNEFSDKAPDAVIITTANDFPDALSGANLASKYNAPILLVNKTVEDSKSTLDYVSSTLAKGKDVYLLGGAAAVSSDIENNIKEKGYNVHRLSGINRYETNQSIVDKLNADKGTPVVICTGEDFADALSVSSIAAFKGYPILLNNKDSLLSNVKDDIAKLQPSTVYIIGGNGVISDNISDQIAQINSNKKPVRIGGTDRYDTSMKIIDAFNLTADTISVATGENFPDALSGSLFAAKNKSGILLINNNVTSAQKSVIKNHNIKTIYVFGGEAVLSNDAVNALGQ